MKNILLKLNFLLSKKQKKKFLILVFFLTIGMMFEVFGLGILIPAISILLDPDIIDKTPILFSMKSIFVGLSDQFFIIIFLMGIVFAYLLKSIFQIFLIYTQNKFVASLSENISNRLFKSYLEQPYEFHINKNSSELLKNIQIEINNFYTLIYSILNVFVELGLIIAIILTLVFMEPLGAITIGVFYGFLSILFLRLTKKHLNKWGAQREEVDSTISKIASEGLGGIKDLIILNKIRFFLAQFSNANRLKAKLNTSQLTVSQLPRFYLELISILGLVSFIILMIIQDKSSTQLISTIGLFVAATFRMLPSLNKIIFANQSIKYYKSTLNIIYDEIINNSIPNRINKYGEGMKFKSKIEFINVSFGYNDIVVLNNIDLKIQKGQIIGVIGESGSGKSTLIDLLLGLQTPLSGKILIDNVQGYQMSQNWKNIIGYVSQTIFLLDDSIKKNIAFGYDDDEINLELMNEVIKQVQLESFVNSLEYGINTKVGERGVQISGGQKQRIGLARALYKKPQILILDEATSALDSKTEEDVMKSIYNLKDNLTIIMIAHRESTLVECDQVFKVDRNQISSILIK